MARPCVGLIAIDRDVVVEGDLHALLDPFADVVTTRIPLLSVGSPASLRALEPHLAPAAVRLSMAAAVVAVACTSAVPLIGTDRLSQRIHEARPDVAVVNPLDSIATGIERLGVRRLGVVSPYTDAISSALTSWFDGRGLTTVATRIRTDAARYDAISEDDIREAVFLAAQGVDAIAITCTDLRVLGAIQSLESTSGVPILTSNQALAWRVSQILELKMTGPGALFDVSR